MSPKNKNELSMSPILCKVPRKKNTQNLRGKGIITLQPLGDDEKIFSGFKNTKKENEDNIDLKRVDELTTVRRRKDNLNIREDSPLKPAFKQSKRIGGKPLKSNRKEKGETNNIEFIDNEDEEKEKKEKKDDEYDEDDDNDKDSSSDSSFEDVEDIEKEDEGLNYQGKLFKYVNEKFKELWFKLVYKDLYYYKNKNEKVHRGMHNLSGLFLKTEGLQEIKGRKISVV